MVNDVMKRTDRLNLAREIIRKELELAGVPKDRFSSVDITKAARIHLAINRSNTDRLRAKLNHLNAQVEHNP